MRQSQAELDAGHRRRVAGGHALQQGRGVVEAPIGCAPHECYGVYEPFFKSLDAYADAIAREPIAGCQRYLERYYYAPKSWTDYLELLGMEEVLDACRRGRSVHND